MAVTTHKDKYSRQQIHKTRYTLENNYKGLKQHKRHSNVKNNQATSTQDI